MGVKLQISLSLVIDHTFSNLFLLSLLQLQQCILLFNYAISYFISKVKTYFIV